MARTKTPNKTIINPATSPYVGLTWKAKGSKGTYDVYLGRSGYRCGCVGFSMHGHCKHITQVDQLLGGDHEDPVYKIPTRV